MSTDKRWSVKLSDIKTVLLKCSVCGAVSGYDPRKWNSVPRGCANCTDIRIADGSPEFAALLAFKDSLSKLMQGATQFEVRLEFNGDEAKG